MASDLISVETSALSVCSSCESETTVTVSFKAPTASVTSTRLTVLTLTGTPVSTNSLKPWSDTFTE